MLTLPVALFLAAMLGLVVLLAIVGLRRPLAGPFAVYAGSMTFGSAVPVPWMPEPFDTLAPMLGLVAGGAIVGHLLLTGQRPSALPRCIAPLVLLLGWAALSMFWSLDPDRTLRTSISLAASVLLFVLVLAARADDRDLRGVERAIIVGGVITASYGFWQLWTGSIGGGGVLQRFAAVGTEADPNATAAAMLLPLLVALGRAETAEHRLERRLSLLAALPIVTALVLAGSRGGIVGALAAFLVVGYLHPRRSRFLQTMAALLVAAGVGLTLAPDTVVAHLQEQHSTGRAQVWEAAATSCSSYCIAGSGYGSFGSVYLEALREEPELPGFRVRPYRPHNIYLGHAIELGVVGLGLALLGLWWLMRDTRYIPRRWRWPPLAALVGLLVSNVFLSHFEFRYFWLVLTYVALVRIVRAPAHEGDFRDRALPSSSESPARTGRPGHRVDGALLVRAVRQSWPGWFGRGAAALALAVVIVSGVSLATSPSEPVFRATSLVVATGEGVEIDQIARLAPTLLDTGAVTEDLATSLAVPSSQAAAQLRDLDVEPVLGSAAFNVVMRGDDPKTVRHVVTTVTHSLERQMRSVTPSEYQVWAPVVILEEPPSPWAPERLVAAVLAIGSFAFGSIRWPLHRRQDHERPSESTEVPQTRAPTGVAVEPW